MKADMHLLYEGPRSRRQDTRCGTGDPKRTTADESLVTCELCRSWAHRGYTAQPKAALSLAQEAARQDAIKRLRNLRESPQN